MSQKIIVLVALIMTFVFFTGCYTQIGTPGSETAEYSDYYDEYYEEDSVYAEEPVYVVNHYYAYGYPYDFAFYYWDPWWITPRWGYYVSFYWGYPYWYYPYYSYCCFGYPYWYYDYYYYGGHYGYVYPENYGRRDFGRRSQYSTIRTVARNGGTRSGGGVTVGDDDLRSGYATSRPSSAYPAVRGGNSANNGSRSSVTKERARNDQVKTRSARRSDGKYKSARSKSGERRYKTKERKKSSTSSRKSRSYRSSRPKSSGSSYRRPSSGSSRSSATRSSRGRSSSSGKKSSSSSRGAKRK